MIEWTLTHLNGLRIYRTYWCHCQRPIWVWLQLVLRIHPVKKLATCPIQHSRHVNHFCPNFCSANQASVWHHVLLAVLDSILNLLNVLHDCVKSIWKQMQYFGWRTDTKMVHERRPKQTTHKFEHEFVLTNGERKKKKRNV